MISSETAQESMKGTRNQIPTANRPRQLRKMIIMSELRRMTADGYTREEIMATLKLSQRSYYRYISRAYEHDARILQEEDRDLLCLEISILHERLTASYRRLVGIAAREDYPVRDRLAAEAAACEVAVAIVKLAIEGPLTVRYCAGWPFS